MNSKHIAWYARVPLLPLAALFMLIAAQAQLPAKSQGVRVKEDNSIRALPADAKRYALVIGVDQYRDKQINSLEGAANDAHRLAEALVKYAAFPQDQVILLTTDQPDDHQPTRSKILRMLSNLGASVPKDGLLLISFAGHGIERNGQAYLLPTDAEVSGDITLLEDTAINVKTVRERIRQTQVKQVMLILDACRDNPIGRGIGADISALTETYASNLTFDVRNREVSAFVTLYAASPGQVAYENKAKKQGYFTLALIEGLQGKAANEQGEVTLGRLVKYLEVTVSRQISLELGAGRNQKPWAEIGGYKADELVIALTPPQALAATAAANSGKPNLYALAIGISKYALHDGGLRDLGFAAADAAAFASEIKKQQGGLYGNVTVKTLTNEQATKNGILSGLAWIQQVAGNNDVSMIYLVGYNAPDPYEPQHIYFIPHDCVVRDLPHTAISVSHITTIASLIRGKAIIFVDTGHAATILAPQGQNIFDEDSNVVIFAACDVNEVGQESSRWGGGHGAFTWALLEGLRGEADSNGEGKITTGELYNYVRDRVRLETAFRQTPKLSQSRSKSEDFIVALVR